jgi:hypothetical protein
VSSPHITSHHITSHHITSRHITSHHITSHHITSHHITSHHHTRVLQLYHPSSRHSLAHSIPPSQPSSQFPSSPHRCAAEYAASVNDISTHSLPASFPSSPHRCAAEYAASGGPSVVRSAPVRNLSLRAPDGSIHSLQDLAGELARPSLLRVALASVTCLCWCTFVCGGRFCRIIPSATDLHSFNCVHSPLDVLPHRHSTPTLHSIIITRSLHTIVITPSMTQSSSHAHSPP